MERKYWDPISQWRDVGFCFFSLYWGMVEHVDACRVKYGIGWHVRIQKDSFLL